MTLHSVDYRIYRTVVEIMGVKTHTRATSALKARERGSTQVESNLEGTTVENENRLGIDDSQELAEEEERIAKFRALELYDSEDFDLMETGTYQCLSLIHRYLLDEVYESAGEFRTANVSSGEVPFVPIMFLRTAMVRISDMPQSTFDQILEKYIEMYLAHPFSMGNGRAMRIWLDAMLKRELSRVVDWSKIDGDAYESAMVESPENSSKIAALLKDALTDAVDDRQVRMAAIDASFAYDGFDAFKVEVIAADPGFATEGVVSEGTETA